MDTASPRRDRDDGFSLPELLIVLVIMPLVVGAIATVVITGFRDTGTVQSRIDDSASATLTDAYYVRDIESATFVTTDSSLVTAPPPNTPPPCGYAPDSGPVTASWSFKLGVSWGGNGPGTAQSANISYSTDGQGNLVRLYCTGDSSVPTSVVTMARGLGDTVGCADPQDLNCAGVTAVITPPQAAQGAAEGWLSSAGKPAISGITLAALTTASTYDYSLSAVPRILTPQNQGVEAGGPSGNQQTALLLLGSGVPALSCSNSGQINVNGSAQINAAADGAGILLNSSRLDATGSIYTADPNVSGAFTTDRANDLSPSPPLYASPATDPYASLTPPSGAGLPTDPAPTVSGGVTTYQPGIYTTTLSTGNNSTAVLHSGVYILQQGLSLANHSSLSSDAGGVLLYITGGSMSESNNTQLTLSPLTSGASPDPGVLTVWQAASDTNALQLSNSSVASVIGGTVYAPSAAVTQGNRANFSVGGLVAGSLSCANNGLITVG